MIFIKTIRVSLRLNALLSSTLSPYLLPINYSVEINYDFHDVTYRGTFLVSSRAVLS